MKTIKLAVSLFVLGMFAPLLALAAPALESVPDVLRSRYTFKGEFGPGFVYAIASNGETLYVAGEFASVDHIISEISYPRRNVAAFSLPDLALLPLGGEVGEDTTWDSGVISALTISSDGGLLYLGGGYFCSEYDTVFDGCIGEERYGIMALNTETSAPTSFDAGSDGDVYQLALSPDDSVLFMTGGFTEIGGEARPNGFAAVTTADGLANVFEPDVDSLPNALAVSPDGSVVYATGGFSGYLKVFDSETGAVTGFGTSLDSLGNALAVSSDGGVLYVGGGFSQYINESGEGVPFNQTTQEPWEVYPKVTTETGGPPATVYAAIPDGSGGWYVGGSFTHVGGVAQPRLAHINASGELDTSFDPVIDNGEVYALALHGTTLYAGGGFDLVEGGTTRNYVAAFNTTNGSVTAFDPNFGATVYALALSSDGETLYAGGGFGVVNGATFRNHVASVATDDGVATDFNPDANNPVLTLALGGDGTLFIGGEFTSVNSETTNDTRNRIAAFTTTGAGTLIAEFNPNANGTVHALKLNGEETILYVGGSFDTIGGESRVDFAALDTSSGLATALDAQIQAEPETVYAVALSPDESTIYIGGVGFVGMGGEERYFFGEIDATTGNATDFNPGFNNAVRAIGVSATDIYLGGGFTDFGEGGTSAVSGVIAIDTTDGSLITEFDPVFDGSVLALKLSSDDALLYAGGLFAEVNGQARNGGVAALNTNNGSVAAFAPNNTYDFYAMELAGDGTELYVGYYDGNDGFDFGRLLVFGEAEGVADETPPVITLLGSTPVNVTLGDVYVDAGATAEDDVDGDITADIITVNPVNTAVVGTYIVTYNVEDTAGNPAVEVTRTVNVSAVEDGGDDDDDGGGGGGGGGSSSRRHTTQVANPILEILTKLILTLQDLIALIIAQQAAQ